MAESDYNHVKDMCLAPVTIKAKHEEQDNPNFTSSHIAVPCGKCPECITATRNTWAFRLEQELKRATTAGFITLTYNNDKLPRSTNDLFTLKKKDYQNFMKRTRKEIMKTDFQLPKFEGVEWDWKHYTTKTGKDKKKQRWLRKIKYFACGEYGTKTQRPHYHAIIFNLPERYLLDYQKLETLWGNGHVHIDQCNMATILYTTSYMLKSGIDHDFVNPETGEYDDRQREFRLMSNGLGENFLTPQMEKHILTQQEPFLVLQGGQKAKLPKYYKDKITAKLDYNDKKEFTEAVRTKSLEYAEQRDDSTEALEYELLQKRDKYRKYEDKLRKERQKL